MVGFVDLVGSTELGEQLDFRELGDVLTTFELVASETVTDAGGRVVKLLGDEVLFTVPDAGSGVGIALDLAAVVRGASDGPESPGGPRLRTGHAARRRRVRSGGQPRVPGGRRSRRRRRCWRPQRSPQLAGCRSEPAGHRQIKGVEGDVELRRVLGR